MVSVTLLKFLIFKWFRTHELTVNMVELSHFLLVLIDLHQIFINFGPKLILNFLVP